MDLFYRDTGTQRSRVSVSLWFAGILRDVLYAFRMMRREPGFTLIAILTLALGIGATTSIFTVVDGVLLRRAPLAGIERLMVLWETDRHSGTTREPASVPDYLDFTTSAKSFDRVSAIAGREANLNPAGGDPVRVAGLAVTRGFLPMLGIKPLVGRDFNEAEVGLLLAVIALIASYVPARRVTRIQAAIALRTE